ncbi:hypothetical protein MNBD_CHLOROFLEXI01-1730, partial [hydrothermal vent metagenome]
QYDPVLSAQDAGLILLDANGACCLQHLTQPTIGIDSKSGNYTANGAAQEGKTAVSLLPCLLQHAQLIEPIGNKNPHAKAQRGKILATLRLCVT